ncbi:hypothetical protein D1007_35563 [Hordeum vulgare]|uniref:Uncharacterized protein n=1 Tax=Hordeum vulgare subsp. vulgare TaxID=112509 RepID=A0A8I7B6M0_HORVV|nr:hypothetical protein D1007_35563 [Hordeum vulgare]KAI5001253.1 hypothetical protein ZWY2020_025903 [Hordeum vulgare]
MADKNKKKTAQQELEDLYLSVPDGSVDLTFRDFVVVPPPPPTASITPCSLAPIHEQPDEDDTNTNTQAAEEHRSNKALLSRTSTNIFTYKVQSSASSSDDDNRHHDAAAAPQPTPGFQLSPSPAHATCRSSTVGQLRPPPASRSGRQMRRAGIPHSNLCATCSRYVHVFRHRCLVCGRAYCRRCVGAGMGDMTEGRKCLDCLGRKYSHRYIHRAGRGATAAAGLLCLCCCALHAWGSSSSIRAQELLWAEKGPAPRRRPSSSSSTTSISASYSTAAGGGYSASMSMTMMSINSGAGNANGHNRNSSNVIVVAPPPASFSRGANPHAFPL